MLRIFERWLVFPAPRLDRADWNPSDLEFEDVYFDADDGTRLHGWYIPHPAPRAHVLFCHGNGEHVADLARRLKVLQQQIGVAVFAWDYRSYGLSKGTPHEENVIADAHVAHRWLAQRAEIPQEEVVLMGRSLGGAVSVAIAAENPVRGLILDRTFSYLPDAAAHNFPWLPVHWIMRNEFASYKRITRYTGPLLQIHGTIDEVVPLAQGRKLFEAAPSNTKKFIEIPDLDHNSPLPDSCHAELIHFFDHHATDPSLNGQPQ